MTIGAKPFAKPFARQFARQFVSSAVDRFDADRADGGIGNIRPGQDCRSYWPSSYAQRTMAARAHTRARATHPRVGPHRSLVVAWAIGSLSALGIDGWLLARAPRNALASRLGSIHDAQARALFHGHWNLKFDTLLLEAFKIDGKYQTYFGIWPTLLRMPVLAVTNRFDGSFTGPSILLAIVVMLIATAGMQYELRNLFAARGGNSHLDALPSRSTMIISGGFQLVIGAGSVVAFLASYPLVYHEMEMWGIAGAVASAWAALRYVHHPGPLRTVGCSLAATITILSRPSLGIGVITMMATLLLSAMLRREGIARVTHLAVAIAIPIVFYGAMNTARFGAPFALPLEKQVFTTGDAAHHFPGDPQRQRALAANDGSLFGLKFLPTTAVQYLRPDAFRFDHRFPFVNFPHWRARVFRGAVFDTLDRSSSITSTMPALVLLSIYGAAAFGRKRRTLSPSTRDGVVAIVVGGAAGSAFVLMFGYVANRYLSDLYPGLIVLSTVGLAALRSGHSAPIAEAAQLPQPIRTKRERCFVGVIAVAAVFSLWINVGLGVVYQRPLKPTDPDYGRGTASVLVGRSSNSSW